MSSDYELRYFFGTSAEPAIDKGRFRNDTEASMRAIRGLLEMPARRSVEVHRDGIVVFARSRSHQ